MEMKPRCPLCGDPVRKAGNNRGKQRWQHPNDKKCSWHGVNPIGIEQAQAEGINRKSASALHRKVEAKRGRYVITAAQNATPVHEKFFQSLLTYCKRNKAQLLVIPYRYKNPTSFWSIAGNEDNWDDLLTPYIIAKDTILNSNLVVLASIMTQPTADSPLAGFETITGSRSGIFGHPKLECTSVPTPQSKLPKLLVTTGTVTVRNYIQSKAGAKGGHHHTFGACVVEIEDDHIYHLRQINSVEDGSFCDLNYEYSGNQVREKPIVALVMGDTHQEFVDPQVVSATFSGKDSILSVLRPEFLVWHDIHDFYARNHHHRGKAVKNYLIYKAGRDNIEEALDETFAFVDSVTHPGITNVIVPSNHPDALARWIDETDPRSDPVNGVFWAQTWEAMCLAGFDTETGPRTIDPFVYWADKKLKTSKQAVFLKRDQSYMIKGIEVGYHGDVGLNGARGSRNGFGRIGVKSIIGHSHSPGIRNGVYQVGTSSYLNLEYQRGPSSWLQTHAIIYSNGKRSLIHIIDGKWRLK